MAEHPEITIRAEKVGDLTVYVEGEEIKDKGDEKEHVKHKEVMITFHDIGQNHTTCFAKFLDHEDIRAIKHRFVIYHIDAPGQETGAEELSHDYQYPGVKQLAEMVGKVIDHFALKETICFGVGAGANVLSHLAMNETWADKVTGLVLVEPIANTASFKEWSSTKINSWQLDTKGFTENTKKYIVSRHFERKEGKLNMELADQFVEEMTKNINPHNLGAFIKAYMSRPHLDKELSKEKKGFKAQAMIVVGEHSPHLHQAESELFRHLSEVSRSKYSILKPDCGASVLEEKPETMAEGLLLFIQGCGMVPTLRTRSMSRTSSFGSAGSGSRTQSMCED